MASEDQEETAQAALEASRWEVPLPVVVALRRQALPRADLGVLTPTSSSLKPKGRSATLWCAPRYLLTRLRSSHGGAIFACCYAGVKLP